MAFCSNCGNELSAIAKFCDSCGKSQDSSPDSCNSCGKAVEENEKFCSGCGTAVNAISKPKTPTESQPELQPQEEKFTKEGRKIITGGPKPGQHRQAPNSPPPISPNKKKKRGCFGCFFRTILIIVIIILLVIGVRFILTKINSPSESKSAKVEIINLGDKKDLVVPGGGTKKSDKPFESDELKKVTNELETILENADIEKLKLMLSESAQEKYDGELDQLKPNFSEYAKAFKKRKLVTSTDFFKVYEFIGENGETYSATFEFQPGDTWKLVRF